MSFLSGFAKAVQEEDNQAHERWLFTEKAKEERKNMLIELSAKRSTGSGSGSKDAGDAAKIKAIGGLLVKEGIPEGTVASLMATGDVEGMESVLETYGELKQYYTDSGGANGMPPDVLSQFLDSIVTEQASTQTVDAKAIAKQLSFELSPEEEELIGSQTVYTPGAIALSSPSFPVKAQDLERYLNLSKDTIAIQTTYTAGKIEDSIQALNLLQEKNIPPTEVDIAARRWLLERKNALKDLDKEDPLKALTVTGNLSNLQSIFESNPRLKNAPAMDVLYKNMGRSAVSISPEGNVSSRQLFDRLAELGAFTEGQMLNIDNKPTVFVGGVDDAPRFSSLLDTLPPTYYVVFREKNKTMSLSLAELRKSQ